MEVTRIHRQLEELQLLKCSLLPGELFTFVLPPEDSAKWTRLLEDFPDIPDDLPDSFPTSNARFDIRLDKSKVWFEVELPKEYPDEPKGAPIVSVKGEDITRDEQERWQTIVKDRLCEAIANGSDYPVYNLLSVDLLPLLHAQSESALETQSINTKTATITDPSASSGPPSPTYHALFTSHHLVSPTKRRNLHQWSADLSITGFSKLGHPGVIYAEGAREEVEEFVSNVKGMQWLALGLRFVEPLEASELSATVERRRWAEFEKVGEVVQEMKRIGRGKYVLEMGIGSASAGTSS